MEKDTIKISITTSDRELIYAIWEAKTDDITIDDPLSKAEGGISTILLYIAAAKGAVFVVERILEIITKYSPKKSKKTKTNCSSSKQIAELRKLISTFENELDIELSEEEQ